MKLTIDHVTRIEGHAKITIQLDESGKVSDTEFHVTQIRGFEKFTEGRPFYEMPAITARICGICPVSHLLASAKACDAIMAVRIPPAGRKLRELVHLAQITQSHALSFFYLSSPDLLLGMDADPAVRNVIGVIGAHPELARDGIDLRKFGQQVIEALAKERVHGSGIVPGGMAEPLSASTRDRILADLPSAKAIATRTIEFFKGVIDNYADEVAHFGSAPMMSAGLVDAEGRMALYDGALRFVDANGEIVADSISADDYHGWIGERSLPESYMKAPYFLPKGYPEGLYRVGALARLNVVEKCGTPRADRELEEFRQRFGRPAHSAFLYHYARLIEIVYALEQMEILLDDPGILDTHVRANAGVNATEGFGMIEAPRGVLIHHYKVDQHGGIVGANLIVATGHNTMAIGNGIREVAAHYIDGMKLQEGMLNRVSAVVRAYDPCLSCSTHALGEIALNIRLVDPRGELLDELTRG